MREEFSLYLESLICSVPEYVYVGLLSVFLSASVLFIWKVRDYWRYIVSIILIEYVILLYCSTVIYRNTLQERRCDLMPFWSYRAIMDGKEQYLAENIMNVVAFVPIGLLLGIGIPRQKWWYALLIGFCLSSSIEILQFVFKKGFSEFDDVIHNTFGCILGYILVKGSRLMVKSSGLINRITIKTI